MSLQSLIESKPKRPEPKPEQRIKKQTVKLVDHSGQHFDSVEVRTDKSLPQIILWGIADAQRAFLLDGKAVYREVSWIWAKMPEYVRM